MASGRTHAIDATLKVPWDAEHGHGHVELGLERTREAVRVALCFSKLRLRIPGVGLDFFLAFSLTFGECLANFDRPVLGWLAGWLVNRTVLKN